MKGLPSRAAFIADSSYNIQKKIVIEKGGALDAHEFTIIDGGKSAIMSIEKAQNVSSVTSKDPDGFRIMNQGFREIDLATGRTKFEWFAFDHGVTVNDSFNPNPLDHL